MLERYVSSPVTRHRLQSGPFGEYADRFAEWLSRRGYRPRTVEDRLRALASWTEWMHARGLSLRDALSGLTACQVEFERGPRVRGYRRVTRESLTAARVFIRCLQEAGVLAPPKPAPSPTDRWPLLETFRSWMRRHRGMTDTTLDVYLGILGELVDRLGDDPASYTAGALRAWVLERARPHGIERAKTIVVAVRAFLRFLGATGQCPPGREHALPGFRSWQLSSVPRFLGPEDVERVIRSCVGHVHELRDRAVILLLARLALRAGEVAGLTFADLDWANGRIAVCGKSRRQEWLPLPQDVGTALLRYLRRGRPPLESPQVFTTVVAPYGPLSRAAVTHIVRSALSRAGIAAPITGAHVLRHSAATAMLRQGASLASVGAVLRHRSLRTTARYAKVDVTLLSEITQPWPGRESC